MEGIGSSTRSGLFALDCVVAYSAVTGGCRTDITPRHQKPPGESGDRSLGVIPSVLQLRPYLSLPVLIEPTGGSCRMAHEKHGSPEGTQRVSCSCYPELRGYDERMLGPTSDQLLKCPDVHDPLGELHS